MSQHRDMGEPEAGPITLQLRSPEAQRAYATGFRRAVELAAAWDDADRPFSEFVAWAEATVGLVEASLPEASS